MIDISIAEPTIEEKEEIVEKCRQLKEVFAKRAPKYDQEGSFPVENFEDLKASGLLGIMIPKEFGGLGADFVTYTKALEQLAMGCSSTALTFNMHNIAVGSIAELNLEGIGGSRGKIMKEFRDWVYHQSINEKKVFASASSEPGIGAHFSKLKTTYRRVNHLYRWPVMLIIMWWLQNLPTAPVKSRPYLTWWWKKKTQAPVSRRFGMFLV